MPEALRSGSPLLALQQSIGNRAVGGILQAKLRTGAPDDEYEREADRVAEQVMRMPEPVVQRECQCGGTCDHCQDEEEGAPLIQAKRAVGRPIDRYKYESDRIDVSLSC
jgi:hypothetical protein